MPLPAKKAAPPLLIWMMTGDLEQRYQFLKGTKCLFCAILAIFKGNVALLCEEVKAHIGPIDKLLR